MKDLRDLSNHIRSIGAEPPTDENRRFVVAHLSHKRQGIQSVAAQALSAWGGRESVEPLKLWLLHGYKKDSWYSIRRVAIKCLAQLVEDEDANWVLDLFLSKKLIQRYELYWLVTALSAHVARKRLVAALHNEDWQFRQAAVIAIGHMDFSDRVALLSPWLNDSEKRVRNTTRNMLNMAEDFRLYHIHANLRRKRLTYQRQKK